MTINVPIWEKLLLTAEEAAAYSGLGKNKIYELCNMPMCQFVIYNGTRKMIKRKEFEKFLHINKVI